MHKGIPHPAELEPATQGFVDSLTGGKPIPSLTPTEGRAVLSGLQTATKVDLPDVEIKDIALPVGPTGKTNVRVMRPMGAGGVLPVIVYMHGGGWVLGDRVTHDRLVRELAVGANAALVFVDYDRSPPSALPDGHRAGVRSGKIRRDECRKADDRRQPHGDCRRRCAARSARPSASSVRYFPWRDPPARRSAVGRAAIGQKLIRD
jgi:acetyl esterase